MDKFKQTNLVKYDWFTLGLIRMSSKQTILNKLYSKKLKFEIVFGQNIGMFGNLP